MELLHCVAFFYPFDGISQSYNNFHKHCGNGHGAKMDKIISLIIHALNDFGDGLFFLADTPKLKEVE